MVTSSSGGKDRYENFAYLPTTVISMENGTLNMAQWNYRFVCHPLKRDLSTKRLVLIDDITTRMAFGTTMEQHEKSVAARYRVKINGFFKNVITLQYYAPGTQPDFNIIPSL